MATRKTSKKSSAQARKRSITPKKKTQRKKSSPRNSFSLKKTISYISVAVIFLVMVFAPFPKSAQNPSQLKTYAQQEQSTSSHSALLISPLFTSLTPSPSPSPIIDDPERIAPSPTPVTSSEPSQPAQVAPFCLTVPIILYHHVEPLAQAQKEGHAQLTVDSTYFDQQMNYLNQQGYHSISIGELVSALLSHHQLPPKSIAVTLDDGYIDDYQYGFMILKKYHIKGNFMIPTGLIMNPDYMTWDNVREIQHSDIGYIYNHTWSHAPLGEISKDKIDFELTTSQKQFQEQLGFQPNIFTYPYGSYSDLAIQELRSHGFIAALTTVAGRTQCDTNIMTLYREHIGNAPMSEYGL